MTPKEYAEHLVSTFNRALELPAPVGLRTPTGIRNIDKSVNCARVYCNGIIDFVSSMHKSEYALFDIYDSKKLMFEGKPDYINGYQIKFFMYKVLQELDLL